MAKKQKPVKLNQQQRTAAEIKGLRERNSNLVQQALTLQAKQKYYNERRDTESRGWKIVADNSIDGTRCHAAVHTGHLESGVLRVMSEVVTKDGQHSVASEGVKISELGLATRAAIFVSALVTFLVTAGVACIVAALV